ncbi:MAG: hypothetical protein DRJ14_00925 [Acidobacteria bacterium]|nr:MAG: hypothetical protein DRJ14_00925 [Acidobacteriota bacterium]
MLLPDPSYYSPFRGGFSSGPYDTRPATENARGEKRQAGTRLRLSGEGKEKRQGTNHSLSFCCLSELRLELRLKLIPSFLKIRIFQKM